MCHVSKIREDDEARIEAGESVDKAGDETVSVAVVAESVVGGI